MIAISWEPGSRDFEVQKQFIAYRIKWILDIMNMARTHSGKHFKRGVVGFIEEQCNAPIPRIRRRYCDVYTQGENTLTNIC